MKKHGVMLLLLGALVSLLSVSAAFAQEEPVLCGDVEATIVGTNGPDKLKGTNDSDVIAALDGDDVINASGGDDLVCGGLGNDKIDAGTGNDFAFGDVSFGAPGGGA